MGRILDDDELVAKPRFDWREIFCEPEEVADDDRAQLFLGSLVPAPPSDTAISVDVEEAHSQTGGDGGGRNRKTGVGRQTDFRVAIRLGEFREEHP